MRAFRVTDYVRNYYDFPDNIVRRKLFGIEETKTGEFDIADSKKLIDEAVATQSIYTAAYNQADIAHDSDVGGFDLPLVTLISSACVSACEDLANLLKSNRLGRLIGTHTSGTGAGYETLGNQIPNWQSPSRNFSIEIPSFLFGSPGGAVGQRVFPGKAEELCSENRPTVADVFYDTTLEDLKNGDQGWLNKAVEVLRSK
jgi:hypothetical protein